MKSRPAIRNFSGAAAGGGGMIPRPRIPGTTYEQWNRIPMILRIRRANARANGSAPPNRRPRQRTPGPQ